LQIINVTENSPAKRVMIAGTNTMAALEVGDVIVAINGQAIRSERDYANAVDNSPQRMSLRIINRKNGRQYDLIVNLAY
jgi:S1-C subfamily serine protease